MSLYYPATDPTSRGKTTEWEDRYYGTVVALMPPHKIVEVITFETVDPAFQGEMLLESPWKLSKVARDIIYKMEQFCSF